MRVLAVGAHPDDLELLCAGTLARYAARGDSVIMAVATNGEVGSSELSNEEIAAIRRPESEASARAIGADLVWMNYRDEFLFSTEETRLNFLDMVRGVRPDVILAHAPVDYHPHHRTSGQIFIGFASHDNGSKYSNAEFSLLRDPRSVGHGYTGRDWLRSA